MARRLARAPLRGASLLPFAARTSWPRHRAVDWMPEPMLLRHVGNTRRYASRFNTPVKDSRNANVDLYDEVFRPMGVSMMQYERLMSFASKCKASEGSVVVKGGQPHTRFCLLTYGVAVAYKHLPESPGELGPPICVYMGRLTPRQNISDEVREKGPVRGSVVGGSALVEPNVTSKAYPADIIAAEPTEWLEWDYDDLQRIIDAPGWRAVQASFYHMLYLELLGTLDRDRASRKTAEAQLDATKTKVVPENKGPPSTKQLAQLCLFVAVPFFGFGFADNAIMIVCGDFIDAQFGVMFGLTTMASAGLGNWLSDTIGLGLGDVIERTAGKMGLSNGNLSPAQERMQPAKLTTLAGKLIGITLGCFAGMVPLLFLKPAKVEIPNEDLEVYESTFMPYGVSTNAFVHLMKQAARRRQPSGHVMVKGGVPFPKVILLLRGEAIAIKVGEDASEVPSLDGTGDPTHKYLGRLEGDEPSSSPALGNICSHGSVVWLEVETASFLGWKPKVCRRVWLVWSNRTVLCGYFLWSFYVFVACPVAYSVTWKLDCTTDLCEAGSTGVATCGVNGCTCSSLMDMSCTPAISKMGALCASVQQPLCRHVNSTGPVSGAHIPMLIAAFVMSGLGCLLGLLWMVNMIFIYGTWTLECGQARQLAQKQARVHHHRFTVSFRSRAVSSGLPVVITLSAKEDPEQVIKVLLPEVDLGDPLFYGENDGASTDVPAAEDDPEGVVEPQWC